jgi:hypothetical protein
VTRLRLRRKRSKANTRRLTVNGAGSDSRRRLRLLSGDIRQTLARRSSRGWRCAGSRTRDSTTTIMSCAVLKSAGASLTLPACLPYPAPKSPTSGRLCRRIGLGPRIRSPGMGQNYSCATYLHIFCDITKRNDRPHSSSSAT